MRSITLLLLSFLCAAGMVAQTFTVSDAPVNGEWAENTHWYTIKNGKGAMSVRTLSILTVTVL